MKRAVMYISILSLLFMAACKNPTSPKQDDPVVTPEVISVTITSNPSSLVKGEKYTNFEARVDGINVEDITVTWSTNSTKGSAFGLNDDPNELSVSTTEGTSLIITASAGGRSDTVTLNVSDPPENLGEVEIKLIIEDKVGNLSYSTDPSGTVPVIKKSGSPSTVTFTVENPGSYTYDWYINGKEKKTGDSITLDAANYPLNYNSVLLTVITIDGKIWSLPEELGFIVEE